MGEEIVKEITEENFQYKYKWYKKIQELKDVSFQIEGAYLAPSTVNEKESY